MNPTPPKPALVDVLSGRRYVVFDGFTIGRAPGASLVIDSRRVSRQHAMIRGDASGFLFYDLKSANGSWVDGRRVDRPVPLLDGSEIRIGSYRYSFLTGTGGARPAPEHFEADATMVLIDKTPMVFMVADIHEFTSLSEGLDEAAVAHMLDPWYTRCRGLVEGAGGTVDKFIGDSVFAYWRSVDPEVRKAAAGCAAGVSRSLEGLGSLAEGRCGVALHIGTAAVGAIGGGDQTALGEAVNLTFRVEGLTRRLGYEVLATAAFIDGWDVGEVRFEPLGPHAVKGFKKEVEVFGLAAAASS